jgi:hypothetical protein
MDWIVQELNQADISIIKKSELKDRLAVIRKAHDKEIKDRETQANKNVSRHFLYPLRELGANMLLLPGDRAAATILQG